MHISFIPTSRAGLIRGTLKSSITVLIAADRDHVRRRILGRWIGFLCIAVALTGCTPAQEQTLIPTATANQIISATALVTAESELAGTSLSFATVAQGEHLSANFYRDAPKVIIIANNGEIEAALRQATGDPPRLNGSPHPLDKLRDIDYARFFVVLVTQGKQCCTGYGVTVRQVMRNKDQVKILATFTSPTPGEGVSPTLTDPYHAISIEKVGAWGQKIHFDLVVDGKVVAQITHFIP